MDGFCVRNGLSKNAIRKRANKFQKVSSSCYWQNSVLKFDFSFKLSAQSSFSLLPTATNVGSIRVYFDEVRRISFPFFPSLRVAWKCLTHRKSSLPQRQLFVFSIAPIVFVCSVHFSTASEDQQQTIHSWRVSGLEFRPTQGALPRQRDRPGEGRRLRGVQFGLNGGFVVRGATGFQVQRPSGRPHFVREISRLFRINFTDSLTFL